MTADEASAFPHAHQAPTVRVGLLGCGNVGARAGRNPAHPSEDVAARTGIRLELVGIAVADPERARPVAIPAGLISADAAALVARPTSTSWWSSSGGSIPPTN